MPDVNPASFFISLWRGKHHKTTNMESNPQLELAYDFLEHTGVNVFLTGKAGTGKTTFLRRLKERSPKRMVVVAPTGVAAINAGGVTIHSFFQLPFGPYVPGAASQFSTEGASRYSHKFSREKINIIRSINLLVIDEISMVRADLLDAVDDVLRRYRERDKPFGGVQLLLIGDLQQLAPVVKEDEWELLKRHYESAYFFHSKALAATNYVAIELKHVYRQQDMRFLELLNRIRENRLDVSTLAALNSRHVPNFHPADEEGYITLTTHNRQADNINDLKLAQLSTRAYSYKAEVKGNFPSPYPTDEILTLKRGAQVMFVKNDSSSEKRYYNGKIGIVTLLADDCIEVVGKEDNIKIRVGQEEWTSSKYTLDETTGDIQETVEGTFRQFPLKTAWAITIHKSQGLTFERVIVDANAAFAHGQVYVALSRCKTFEGLVLSTPLNARAMIKDASVENFVAQMEENEPGETVLKNARQQYFRELLLEQFDYAPLKRGLRYLYRLFSENLRQLYPELTERYRIADGQLDTELLSVSSRFHQQLEGLMKEGEIWESNPLLAERVTKGAAYFLEHTQNIFQPLLEESLPEIDNKEVRKQVEHAMARLKSDVSVKLATLRAIRQGFCVTDYLRAKAKAQIEKSHPKTKSTKSSSEKITVSSDIRHPKLYNRLRTWRNREAERQKLPAYTIMQQKALLGIANTLPSSSRELLAIPGIGKRIVERYGAAILDLVDEYRLLSSRPDENG